MRRLKKSLPKVSSVQGEGCVDCLTPYVSPVTLLARGSSYGVGATSVGGPSPPWDWKGRRAGILVGQAGGAWGQGGC